MDSYIWNSTTQESESLPLYSTSVAAAPVAGASQSHAASAGPVNIAGWAKPWVLVFTKPS